MAIKQQIKFKDEINFEADQQDAMKKTGNIQSLADQVERLETCDKSIEDMEAKLKNLKKSRDILSGEVIPTMMQEMNISTLKLADGTSVEVKPVYGASITVANKEAAYTWLRENGLGDLIKNEITVSFGRNEDNKAQQYAVLAQGQGFDPVQKLKVEPMTLKALVRERLESGQEMPSDLFNVFAGNRTKVTRSK